MALLPGEIESLRAFVVETLPLTADIQRNMSVTITLGQRTEDWQSILPDGPVACGMRQPSASIAQQFASLIGVQQASVFTFPDGQDVQGKDRILVLGSTWTVQAPLTPQSYSVGTQVLATKVG